jgi:acetylglutamate kinase
VCELVTAGVATGGMQAKLEAAVAGITAGVQNVTIALGRESNVCSRVLAGEPVGTCLVAES